MPDIRDVQVFPGSGIAFNFLNPDNSNVFVSFNVTVTGLEPAASNSRVFIVEYEPDGTFLREFAVDDPDFQVVEGLSFFESSNLLFGGGTEREKSRIKEYTTEIVIAEGGLNIDLTSILGDRFKLEGLTFNARNSIFVVGELGDLAQPFLYELDKNDGRILKSFNLNELSGLEDFDPGGLGFDATTENLLLVGNLEGDAEDETSKLFEITFNGDALEILDEIDLGEFNIVEAEGVAFDQTTGTLFIAQGAEDPQEPELVKVTFTAGEDGRVSKLVYDTTAVDEETNINMKLTDDVLELGTDASFDNLVGLFEVVDADGGIDSDGDGQADPLLTPGDANFDPSAYAMAAIVGRVDSFEINAGSDGDPSQNTTAEQFGDVVIVGNTFYAPFIIANGGSIGFDGFVVQEDAEENSDFNNAAEFREEQVAYFTFLEANPDGVEHLQSFGNNIFGFEDLPDNLGISDNDFNDAIFQFDFVV